MKHDTQFFLRHILICTEKAQQISLKSENSNQLSIEGLAVTGLLHRIGIAMKAVPNQIRSNHPEIQWNQMITMSDRLLNRYWETDMHEVSAIVGTQLPALQKTMQRILQELEN